MYNHLLDTFILVVECGSFTKASERLFISTAGVKKQIDTLEKDLGVILFDRTHKGTKLTKEGKIIYDNMPALKKYCKDILSKVKGKTNDKKEINISVSNSKDAENLIKLMYLYKDLNKKYEISIFNIRTAFYDSNTIKNKKYNLIFGYYDSNYLINDYEFLNLGESFPMINVPKVNPLAKKKELKLKDLNGTTLICANCICQLKIEQFCNSKLSSFLYKKTRIYS